MRSRPAMILVWLVTGAGAVGGSIAGSAGGQYALFAGAIVGGVIAAASAPALAVRLGWIEAGQRRAASLGAVIGFLIAAPIAATNLHTPVIPVLICSLAGVGALVGAGRAMPPSPPVN